MIYQFGYCAEVKNNCILATNTMCDYMQKRLNSVEFVCNGWADREKWPQFSTLLISFSSYESEAMGKALAFSKGNTDFLNLKQGFGIGIFWQLPFFAENQTRVCSVRGGGGGWGAIMFLRRYSHSLPTERPTVYERRVYGLNQRDFKKVYGSCVSVLFWKSLESF